MTPGNWIAGAAFVSFILFGFSYDIRRWARARRHRKGLAALRERYERVDPLEASWSVPTCTPDHERGRAS